MKYQSKEITKLPDLESFDLALNVKWVEHDLMSFVLLNAPEQTEIESLEVDIDYYAPAVAARLGLILEHTLFFLCEERVNSYGVEDRVYKVAHIRGVEDDGFGRLRAEKVEIRPLGALLTEKLKDSFGIQLSDHIQKLGVFKSNDTGRFMTARITDYDGCNYYESGLKINGELVEVLE